MKDARPPTFGRSRRLRKSHVATQARLALGPCNVLEIAAVLPDTVGAKASDQVARRIKVAAATLFELVEEGLATGPDLNGFYRQVRS